MANLIAGLAGIIAVVLGIFCIKYRSQAKKTKSLLSTVVQKASQSLSDKAENDMAETIIVSSHPIKQDIDALEKAKDKVETIISATSEARPSHSLPEDIKEIAERSAERIKNLK